MEMGSLRVGEGEYAAWARRGTFSRSDLPAAIRSFTDGRAARNWRNRADGCAWVADAALFLVVEDIHRLLTTRNVGLGSRESRPAPAPAGAGIALAFDYSASCSSA